MKIDVGAASVYAYTGTRPLIAGQPTVVFIHGAAHDHSVWALQSRYFAYHGRNVLAVDLPGHGRSEGAPLPSVESLAEWTIALLDGLDVERAALVGHSMGALVALECAGRHVDRVMHLALLGPAVPMEVSDALLEASQADETLAFALINGWSFSGERQLGGNTIPGAWMTGAALRLLERSRPGVLATDLAACARYAGGIVAARAVRCASLVVLGARDLMAPSRNARLLVDTLGEARVVSLPRAGHSLMAEEPDAVLDALRGFL